MDSQELSFRRWCSNHGLAANILDGQPLPAMQWSELLTLKNELNRAVTASTDGNADLTGQDWDAVEVANEVIANAKREMDQRDRLGNRAPRSANGRLSSPSMPGAPGQVHAAQRSPIMKPWNSASWASLHGVNGAGGQDFRGIGEFFSAVRDNDMQRLRALRPSNSVMTEGVGEDGGFAVPPQYASEIMDVALESEIVRPYAMFLQMAGPSLTMPLLRAFDHTDGNIGGFRARWGKESGTNTTQKATLGFRTLKADKLSVYADASVELAMDAPNFDGFLTGHLGRSIAFGLDCALLTGDGAGMPRGALNDQALIVVSPEGGQAADTVNASNLLKMYARLHPACYGSAVWVVNHALLPQVMSIHIMPRNLAGTEVVGVSAGPVLRQEGAAWFLMGRPCFFTEKVPGPGDQGDIGLFDFAQFGLGIRQDVTVERNQGPGWYEDELSWRVRLRAAGGGMWESPVTPKFGGATLSWAVTLGAR